MTERINGQEGNYLQIYVEYCFKWFCGIMWKKTGDHMYEGYEFFGYR